MFGVEIFIPTLRGRGRGTTRLVKPTLLTDSTNVLDTITSQPEYPHCASKRLGDPEWYDDPDAVVDVFYPNPPGPGARTRPRSGKEHSNYTIQIVPGSTPLAMPPSGDEERGEG